MTVTLHSAFLNVRQSGGVYLQRYLIVTWLVPCETAASRRAVCVHHTTIHQFAVLFEATYVHLVFRCMLGFKYFFSSVFIVLRTLRQTTGSLTCVRGLSACVYTWRTLVYILIRRDFSSEGSNFSSMFSLMSSFAEL